MYPTCLNRQYCPTHSKPISYNDLCDIIFRCFPDHSSCSQQTCSASYSNSMQYVTRGSNPQFCSVLKTYLECMRQTDRACKGNLYYHSMSVLIINWMTQYNCSAMGLTPLSGGNNHRRPPSGKTRSPNIPPTPTALRVCTYKYVLVMNISQQIVTRFGAVASPEDRSARLVS